MEHLRFEDTKRIMSAEKFRVFRETGHRSRGHLREYYQHRYYFFGFDFLETSRSCRPKYPLMIFVKSQPRCPELDVCQSLSGI